MIECNNINDMLTEYVNGSIKKEDISKVVTHIAQCAQCRNETALLFSIRKEYIVLRQKAPDIIYKTAFDKITYDEKKPLTLNEASKIISQSLSITKKTCKFAASFI